MTRGRRVLTFSSLSLCLLRSLSALILIDSSWLSRTTTRRPRLMNVLFIFYRKAFLSKSTHGETKRTKSDDISFATKLRWKLFWIGLCGLTISAPASFFEAFAVHTPGLHSFPPVIISFELSFHPTAPSPFKASVHILLKSHSTLLLYFRIFCAFFFFIVALLLIRSLPSRNKWLWKRSGTCVKTLGTRHTKRKTAPKAALTTATKNTTLYFSSSFNNIQRHAKRQLSNNSLRKVWFRTGDSGCTMFSI